MAYIKTLKENELIGGRDNTDVYAVSSTQAIFSQDESGKTPDGVEFKLEDRLKRHEADIEALNKKMEDPQCDCEALTKEEIITIIGRPAQGGGEGEDACGCDCEAIEDDVINSLN